MVKLRQMILGCILRIFQNYLEVIKGSQRGHSQVTFLHNQWNIKLETLKYRRLTYLVPLKRAQDLVKLGVSPNLLCSYDFLFFLLTICFFFHILDRISTKLGQNDQCVTNYKSYQQFDLKGHVGVTGVKNVIFKSSVFTVQTFGRLADQHTRAASIPGQDQQTMADQQRPG